MKGGPLSGTGLQLPARPEARDTRNEQKEKDQRRGLGLIRMTVRPRREAAVRMGGVGAARGHQAAFASLRLRCAGLGSRIAFMNIGSDGCTSVARIGISRPNARGSLANNTRAGSLFAKL